MALALLAAVEGASAPTVEVTLTGSSGPPVSAAQRSLSDVARELREGRKAVGGFSAVETTVPQARDVIVSFPVSREEEIPEERASRELEPVPPPPAYVETYVPMWFGGGAIRGRHPGVRPPHVAHRPAGRPPRPHPGMRGSAVPVRPQPN